ncbi:MAG: methionyl-tRNA formyltransferase, partial [Chloroflexi bacterium]|nr:methionyl-tRNA formyltransferase [Chloroflexota bacterium]
MRIVLIGQAAFGAEVLKRLLEKGEEVVAVYVPPDVPGAKGDPLKSLAAERGVGIRQPVRMRGPGVFKDFARLRPDLAVMAFVTDIVPQSILACPRLGTIQYHPSLLPRHRGG